MLFFFYQNDNTIHKYSCTSSTYQSSSHVQSSTWKVNEEAIFHIMIVLSLLDRNKSMQYSSLAFNIVSDLAPSSRWGQWERPDVIIVLVGFFWQEIKRIIILKTILCPMVCVYDSPVWFLMAVQVGNLFEFYTNNVAKSLNHLRDRIA